MNKIIIFSDGGARGNPGPAGIGIAIKMQNAKIKSQNDNAKCKIVKIAKYIGIATNNQAEYRAVIEALKWIKTAATYEVAESGEVEFFLDSQLVVEQLNQRYKLKNEGLKPLFWEIRDLVMQLGGKVTFSFIPREQNKEADRLVNLAIDNKLKTQMSNLKTTTQKYKLNKNFKV